MNNTRIIENDISSNFFMLILILSLSVYKKEIKKIALIYYIKKPISGIFINVLFTKKKKKKYIG